MQKRSLRKAASGSGSRPERDGLRNRASDFDCGTFSFRRRRAVPAQGETAGHDGGSAFPGRGGLLQLAHGAAGRRNRSQPFPGRTGRISVGEKRDDFGGALSGRGARRPAAPHLPDFRQRRPGIPAFELGSAGRAVRCRRVVGSDGPRPGGKTSLRGRHRPSPLDARRWKSGFPAPGRIGREVGPAGSGVDGPGVYFSRL